ncbi:acyltransferase [Methanobrevibacter sp.]
MRAIAIFAVIFCHAGNFYPYILDNLKVAIPFFVGDLGRTGVPIFFLLSGALLLNREYDLVDFFKRRYSRILIPFIFWVTISVILKFAYFGNSTDSIIEWVLGKGLLWYIWELFGLYLFVPVINAFINKYDMQGVKYLLIIWIIYLIMRTFHIEIFPNLKLQYFSGFIGYLVLGYYIANTELNIDDKKMIILSSLLFIVCYIYNCYLSLQIGLTIEYLTVTIILQGVSAFIIIKRIASYSKRKPDALISRIHNYIENGVIGKFLISVSICSYGMYFVHHIIYLFYDKIFDPQLLKFIPIWFITCTILSWLIILGLSKIPYINMISGAK